LRTSSAAGTHSFMLRRLDPRPFDALMAKQKLFKNNEPCRWNCK
jgi:hypothetical protein